MRIACGLALVLALGRTAAAQSPAEQPEPILETGDLMLLIVKPAYDDLRAVMASPPADRRQWAQIYQRAARLAEFENLILFRPHERSDRPEWKTLAANARKASAAVAAVALKGLGGDKDATFEETRKAFNEVSTRCNACHRAMSREAPTIKPDN